MSDDQPKSAYELAMARLRRMDQEAGVVERALTPQQKAAIAEVRRACDARIAEREILHRDAVRRAASPEEVAKLEAELAQDRGRFVRERDRKIAEIRERP